MLNMEFQNDLGLDFLMNTKKKISSDAISISSKSSAPLSVFMEPEQIDVRQHLVPPSPKKSEYSYSEADDDDDDEDEEEEGGGDGNDYETDSQESEYKKPAVNQKRHSDRPRYSEEDIINQKKELLYQFERLERKGARLARKFSLSSNLEEMKIEYDRIKRDREIDNSVKFQKRMMMTAVSGMEFAADKIPFIQANLSGWSNTVNDELDEYDDIFVELHDKYKGKAKIAPELRLIGGLAGSAFMFHMTHKFSSSLPGLDSVLKQNPDLAAKLAEATRNQMNSQQQTAGSFFGGLGNLGGMFGNMFGGGGGQPQPMPQNMAPQQNYAQQRPYSPPIQQVRMNGPGNVDDILNELKSMTDNNSTYNMQDDRVEMMSTISESDLGDLPDDVSSINGLFVNKKGKTINLDI